MVIDVRAREMAQLRQIIRELEQSLKEAKTSVQEVEGTARDNDQILLTLHKLALLLIKKPADWQAQVVAVLKKDFALSYCRLMVLTPADAALAKTAARLPAGGKPADALLAGVEKIPAARRYFYLPLKQERKVLGLLVFASKKADAFPEEAGRDYTRRLAEMLAMAL